MKILSIETSCDETAVAILEGTGSGTDFTYKILGTALLSQAEAHAQYGGVFPNLAKREHGRNLTPVLMQALLAANMLSNTIPKTPESEIEKIKIFLEEHEHEMFNYLSEFLRSYGRPEVDAIAVTAGPGLEPALWVGINFARALAHVWNLPVVPVNHMEGHIMMAAVHHNESTNAGTMEKIEYPALALLVSGGHTELVLMKAWLSYELLGATRDDAAGEAFDKCARILGLTYPGGPEIARLAHEARAHKVPRTIELPRPMMRDDTLEFSFAGLKTAVKNAVADIPPMTPETQMAIAREVEDAIVEVLVTKTMRAVDLHGVKTLIVGGGVSANEQLRVKLREAAAPLSIPVLLSPTSLSTDNAVMIALAGYFHAEKQEFAEPSEIRANGNLKLG